MLAISLLLCCRVLYGFKSQFHIWLHRVLNLWQKWFDGVLDCCVIIRISEVIIMYGIYGEIGVFDCFFADNGWYKGCF